MRYVYLTISFLFATCVFVFPQSADATAYYIDFSCTTCSPNNGTATTTAFTSLDAFTEAARSAGDIAFVRRGVASTTGVSQLDFTSDGTSASPIILTADYDNLWSDFATTSQTYTFAVGSTTATASANQSDIVVGNWLYVMGDCGETYNTTTFNSCPYAYEVSAVSSTSISFYLPYKGLNAGAGKEVRKMPSAPQWNVASGNFTVNISADEFWVLKGLDLRGTNSGVITFAAGTNNTKWYFEDIILTGNGASDFGIISSSNMTWFVANKIRTSNVSSGSVSSNGGLAYGLIKNSSLSNLISASGNEENTYMQIEETSLTGGIALGSQTSQAVKTRNVLNTTFSGFTTNTMKYVFNEDYNGNIGLNTQFADISGSNTVWVASSTSATGQIRSGGGPTSLGIVPSTLMGPNAIFGAVLLFEYPIYTDTASKQYDVYFRNSTSTEFTTNPTTKELWIECEYWDYPTGGTARRTLKKSTGTLDLTDSTDWQSLSVSCQPTASGILYLRGWYAKTKEAGQTNQLLMDTTPVIQ